MTAQVHGRHASENRGIAWLDAVLGGVIAGLAAGALFHYQLFLLPLLGALVGHGSVVWGLAVHLAASVVFAVAFVALLARPTAGRAVDTRTRVVLAGVGYGVVLFVAAFGVGLPLATTVTPVRALPVPYLLLDALGAHLLYGLGLGVVVAVLGGR